MKHKAVQMVFAFLGTTTIIIILVIALLVFGPEKLPEIGKQVGSAMRELNKVRSDVQKALELDEFTNSHYDSSSHNTYDTSYDSAASHHNELPAYDSPHGVTHPAATMSDYEGHYGVSEPASGGGHAKVYDAGSGELSGFVAPPGPKTASADVSLASFTETHSDQQGTV